MLVILCIVAVGVYVQGSGQTVTATSEQTNAAAANPAQEETDTNQDAWAAEWDWREIGQAVFMKNCAACHGVEGEGIPGVFPAFAENTFVTGEAKAVIRVPMNGRDGMPSFRDVLTDEEFAAVLSHIRNSWGNEADPIAPELVAEVRGEDERGGN